MERRIILSALGVAGVLLGMLGVVALLPTSRLVRAETIDACPANLAAYWKLDETSGTIFDDFIGASDGTCTGNQCPATATGKVGSARDFDGTNDQISIPGSSTFSWGADESFSIEAWVKGDSNTCNGGNEVFIGQLTNATNRWWMGCINGTARPAFRLNDVNGADGTGSGALQATSGPALNDNTWHHIVAIHNGATDQNQIYVDGTQVAAANVTYSPTAGFGSASTPLIMGKFDTGFFFDGVMDQVAIYDKALTPTEITRNYQLGLLDLGYCTAAPALTLDTVITPNPLIVRQGNPITFTYRVGNASGAPVKDLVVTDGEITISTPNQKLGGDTDTWLEVGETWEFVRTLNATTDGPISSTASVAGNDPGGTPATPATDSYNVTVDVITTPNLDVTTYTITPNPVYSNETLLYTAIVQNTGSDPLKNVSVSDNICGTFTTEGNDELAVNATRTFTCSGTPDGDATSTVQAIAQDLLNGNVGPATQTATINQINPAITLIKTVDKPEILPGDTVVYSYIVTNSGDDPLENVTVTDACVNEEARDEVLNPEATWEFTCSQALTADTDSAATVAGIDSRENPVAFAATAPVEVIAPEIAIEKTVDKPVVAKGAPVTYTYSVSNSGDFPLSSVSVSDAGCASVNQATQGDGDTTLEVNEVWTYTCTTTLEADTNSVATATGAALETTVTASDSVSVDVVDFASNALIITEQATPAQFREGTAVTFTYIVKNTDDDALTNVVVTDPKCAPVTGPTVITGNGDAVLDAGETWEYTCSTIYTAEMEGLSHVTALDILGNSQEASAPTPGFAAGATIYLPILIQ